MKLKKTTKIKLIIIFICIVLDILVLPHILRIIDFLKIYKGLAFQVWLKTSFIDSLKEVFINKKFQYLYLCVQPFILLWFLHLLWNTDKLTRPGRLNEFGTPEAAGNNQFGSSRWATEKEINKSVYTWELGKSIPEKGGLILGADFEKNEVYIDSGESHILMIGATGSGKTRRCIFPSIWELGKAGESIIATDPKGELYERSKKYLENLGYNVVLIDFRDPTRGNHWNPMDPVNRFIQEKDFSKAVEAALSISHAIASQSAPAKGGDKFWTNGEEALLNALILATAIECDEENQKHIPSVYNLLSELAKTDETGNSKLNSYIESLGFDHIAYQSFAAARISADKTKQSFYASAIVDLRLFMDPNLASMTSYQDHDLAAPGNEKTALFLVIPDDDETRYPLATLYINQSYQALIDNANKHGGKNPVKVNYLLDEFGNLPSIPSFDKKITVARSRNIKFVMILQGLDQLKNHYGDSAKTISGNCKIWVYLLTQDNDTKAEISKMTGTYTVATESYSSTLQQKSHSIGSSSGLTSRALLTPDEVGRWAETGKSLILIAGKFPMALPLPDLSKYPADKDLEKGGLSEKKEPEEVFFFRPILKFSSSDDEEDDEERMKRIERKNAKRKKSIMEKIN